jgi:hypothetical protein
MIVSDTNDLVLSLQHGSQHSVCAFDHVYHHRSILKWLAYRKRKIHKNSRALLPSSPSVVIIMEFTGILVIFAVALIIVVIHFLLVAALAAQVLDRRPNEHIQARKTEADGP